MSKIKSNSGREYRTNDTSRNSFSLTDDNGNKSVYSFENYGSALEHINDVESGRVKDAGNFGK